MPSGLRVNCTADASAKYSRCLDIAALIISAANIPNKPTVKNNTPDNITTGCEPRLRPE